jgi:hypothetical protein
MKDEKFAYQYLKYLKGSLTCCKIFRHGTSGFIFHPKGGVLQIVIALKNPSPELGLNSRPLELSNDITSIASNTGFNHLSKFTNGMN